MFDWLLWFTEPNTSRTVVLVLLFATFCGILIYVFTGKRRKKRLESYKYIPFLDEDSSETGSQSPKVTENERNRQ
jgi:cbb3-type cytochrome oxidase subunit 3